MSKKVICLLSLALALGLVSRSYSKEVVVSNFEGALDGWYTDTWTAGTISLGTTGATAGTQALQVGGPGGWQQLTKVNVKPHMAALATKGVKITADVTAFAADMTTTWMQVGMVLNCQSNNDNGANNNLGWIDLGSQDVARDGQPHTLTWVLPDAVTAKIAGANDNISWFEFLLISNVDGASVAKFYVDNIKISYPDPTSSIMIGDFEGSSLDNWSKAWETTPVVLANATTGVTSGSSSLSLTTTEGYWCLQWNAPTVPASLAGTKLQFDLTMIASEWPVGKWTKVADKVALNSNGTSGWKEYTTTTAVDKLTQQSTSLDWGRWWDAAPDVVKTYTVDISDYDVTGATWFQITMSIQGGNGLAHFYFDNMQLVSPLPPDTGKSTDVVIGNWEQALDGWVAGGGADAVFNDHNGVTLGKYSLDVFVPTGGGWNQDVLVLNLLDPNQSAALAAFRANTKISVDVTRLVADWPTDVIPRWNELALVVNTGGDGWSAWVTLPVRAGWNRNDGDQTTTATWDYGARLAEMHNLEGVTWLELRLVTNVNADYTGWLLFYLDNMKLSGGGVPLNPKPANAAVDVPVDSKLSWTAGALAAKHQVYFGTDAAKVRNANKASDPNVVFAELTDTSFDPNGMAFKTKYYWRVDEVNEANPDSPWKGPVWSFTSANFLVVDDFESYNDIDPPDAASHTIFGAWADGFGTTTNGAVVGNALPPYTERTVVHSGAQAMPIFYDNTLTAVQSETQRVWAAPQDWTINGFNALKFFVHGSLSNIAGQMYLVVTDSAGASTKLINANSAITTADAWTEWVLSLDEIKAAGVNTAAVSKLVIGVANLAGQPKATGVLAIDDIRVGFKPLGLVAYYAFENNLTDGSGNGHNGTLAGDANLPVKYVTGPAGFGQALLFDGGQSGHQFVELGTFNPSAATDQLSIALWAKWDGPSDYWQSLIAKRHSGAWDRNIMMWYFELERNAWDVRFYREGSGVATGKLLQVGQWTHLAVTFDGTTARIYFDGALIDEGSFSFGNDTEAPMHIGATSEAGGNPFNGALDEVRIYDSVLSQTDIAKLAGK